MSKSDFDAFVKRQQAEADEAADFDPKAQLCQWLDYLNALYSQMEAYLQTYLDGGAAKITRRSIQLNEEFIGDYSAPTLTLTIGRSTVTFTPVGTMLIGTKGRVDVEGPTGTARLVLVDKQVTNARQLIRVTVTPVRESPPASAPEEKGKKIEWAWKISNPPPEMTLLDLTQDTFFSMILAVANG